MGSSFTVAASAERVRSPGMTIPTGRPRMVRRRAAPTVTVVAAHPPAPRSAHPLRQDAQPHRLKEVLHRRWRVAEAVVELLRQSVGRLQGRYPAPAAGEAPPPRLVGDGPRRE